ncbi:RNA polymerase sigma factor [Sphingobium sp.]|uniref:RNA polymerase sigma factor n=1 Tax=Sphingobium sp. TaxID=1912891 RepID=UPI003B3B6C17
MTGELRVAGEQQSELVTSFMLNRNALARFLAIRCGSDGAEDLMQELWIKVQHVDTVVDMPLSYLYRMAHRLVLDMRRGASRGRDRDWDWSFVQGITEAVEAPIAERALLARERLRLVEQALASVSSRAMRIFTLYRVDGIEQRRIADEMGISISTVEKDLRRSYAALARLRDNSDMV